MSLLKMTILSFKKKGERQLTDIPEIYMVMFNPSSYKTETKIEYNKEKAVKEDGTAPKLVNVGTQSFTFDFVVDGTGAAGYKRNVFLDVNSFRQIVGFDKSIADGKGYVRYLILMWGTFMFKCVIEAISVNYTLFDSAGIPLRATISATFLENKDEPPELFSKVQSFFNDNPLSGAMSVANVAYAAFNAVDQTVAIAKANDLDSIRQPVTGGSIKLP